MSVNVIKKIIQKYNNGSFLIHSDLNRGFKFDIFDRQKIINKHIDKLISLFNAEIYMPSFNYNFLSTGVFDLINDESQSGVISENFRKEYSNWRTTIPVFSFCGIGKAINFEYTEPIDPFDSNSFFQYCYNNKTTLMHYGSDFNSTTLLHFAERISGNLSYRYNKVFEGIIKTYDKEEIKSTLLYHVRPLNSELNYDWNKIKIDLINIKLLDIYKNGRTNITFSPIQDVVDFWLDKLNNNPFYFLDKTTTNWVQRMLDQLGRKFIISDFE